jgi:tRNA uridine 5-carboxymethylaminomethyl modification enzyme
VDEGAAVGIAANLNAMGFELARLKTGTPPRLDINSIDWEDLPAQVGDDHPQPFSDLSPDVLSDARFPHLPQIQCRITSTTHEAHELIRANLHRAPMYSGQIDAETGPRYCPSIEDKVVRFADRQSHHVFLEPESLHSHEIYANGISTSLPADVQEAVVHAMPGCANARILKWGYAVEYDVVRPHQIDATCMTKRIDGLFLAGQINGTSGYEEAAGQGLIAGLNAARLTCGQELIRFGRDEAYLGVMMDDLVTKTPREPYRMFTSRAEFRLLLRACNSDVRLTPIGRELGLVDDHRWHAYEHRRVQLDAIRARMRTTFVQGGKTLHEVVRRPDFDDTLLHAHLDAAFDPVLVERVITESKYEGYISRQQAEIKRQRKAEHQAIPDWLNPYEVNGLRAEAAGALAKFRPATLGQASRLEGVNPADITLLAVAIKRGRAERDDG